MRGLTWEPPGWGYCWTTVLGHVPVPGREGTGNALYWISRGAGKSATRLGVFWAGQHPKGMAHTGVWRGPACPTKLPVAAGSFSSTAQRPAPALGAVGDHAGHRDSAARGDVGAETKGGAQRTRRPHERGHELCGQAPKSGLKPEKPAEQKAARSLGAGGDAAGLWVPGWTWAPVGAPPNWVLPFGSLFSFLSPLPGEKPGTSRWREAGQSGKWPI